MSRLGADLALLLLGGFRSMVDAVQVELARRGYEMLRQGEAIFDELRERWAQQLGSAQLETLQS